jgi:hypothetical protein
MTLFGMVEDLAFRAEQLLDLKKDLAARLGAATDARAKAALAAFAGKAEALRGDLVSTREAGGAITGEERLREKLAKLYNGVQFQPGPPSLGQLARIDALKGELAAAFAAVDKLGGADLTALNASLAAAGQAPVALLDRAAWDARTKQ